MDFYIAAVTVTSRPVESPYSFQYISTGNILGPVVSGLNGLKCSVNTVLSKPTANVKKVFSFDIKNKPLPNALNLVEENYA